MENMSTERTTKAEKSILAITYVMTNTHTYTNGFTCKETYPHRGLQHPTHICIHLHTKTLACTSTQQWTHLFSIYHPCKSWAVATFLICIKSYGKHKQRGAEGEGEGEESRMEERVGKGVKERGEGEEGGRRGRGKKDSE